MRFNIHVHVHGLVLCVTQLLLELSMSSVITQTLAGMDIYFSFELYWLRNGAFILENFSQTLLSSFVKQVFSSFGSCRGQCKD